MHKSNWLNLNERPGYWCIKSIIFEVIEQQNTVAITGVNLVILCKGKSYCRYKFFFGWEFGEIFCFIPITASRGMAKGKIVLSPITTNNISRTS